MERRMKWSGTRVGAFSVLALTYLACAAGDGSTFKGGSGNTGNGNGGSTASFNPTGTGGGDGVCTAGMDEDHDADGYTRTAGDCNDCDVNVNPGAVEVATDATDPSAKPA